MKPITEQKRQELAAELRDFLNKNTFLRNTLQKQAYEIALASLTAEPEVSEIESVHPENGNTIILLRRGGLKNISPEDIAEYEMIETEKFYTAPPVPVINVPEKLPCDVRFDPGMIFRKGVLVQTMLDALIRRDDYEKELAELSEGERKARQEKISEFLNSLGE